MINDSLANFFFFQAEDGIRDLYVTGVQTCALPILHPPPQLLVTLQPREEAGLRQLGGCARVGGHRRETNRSGDVEASWWNATRVLRRPRDRRAARAGVAAAARPRVRGVGRAGRGIG